MWHVDWHFSLWGTPGPGLALWLGRGWQEGICGEMDDDGVISVQSDVYALLSSVGSDLSPKGP